MEAPSRVSLLQRPADPSVSPCEGVARTRVDLARRFTSRSQCARSAPRRPVRPDPTGILVCSHSATAHTASPCTLRLSRPRSAAWLIGRCPSRALPTRSGRRSCATCRRRASKMTLSTSASTNCVQSTMRAQRVLLPLSTVARTAGGAVRSEGGADLLALVLDLLICASSRVINVHGHCTHCTAAT